MMEQGGQKMHECPNCGQMTEGTYDEDGVRWDICEDCFEELNYETEQDHID